MSLKWILPLAVVWALAAWGALALAALPVELEHDWCGVWGCYPPLPALAAMHLFWIVVLVPGVAWALASARPVFLRLVGGIMLLGSGLATIALVGWDLWDWLSVMPPELHTYWARRALYKILMLSDVPLMQILLAGVICLIVGRRKRAALASAALRPVHAPAAWPAGSDRPA